MRSAVCSGARGEVSEASLGCWPRGSLLSSGLRLRLVSLPLLAAWLGENMMVGLGSWGGRVPSVPRDHWTLNGFPVGLA